MGRRTAMRTTAFLLAALVICSATAAHAGDVYDIKPPAKYDHAYNGKLVVTRVEDEYSVRIICAGVKFQADVGALACSQHNTGPKETCIITMLDDEGIEKAGWTPKVVLRHEIGHCNGWGADHAGALPWRRQDWDSSPYGACAELAEHTNRKEKREWERCLAREKALAKQLSRALAESTALPYVPPENILPPLEQKGLPLGDWATVPVKP